MPKPPLTLTQRIQDLLRELHDLQQGPPVPDELAAWRKRKDQLVDELERARARHPAGSRLTRSEVEAGPPSGR